MRTGTWSRRVELPLTAASVAFLGAYAWPILQPDLAPGLVTLCSWVTWLTWGIFAIDYAVRWRLATDRPRFLRRHLPDLLVLVLPLLRPLRLLRLVLLFRTLNRSAGNSLRGRVSIFVGGATALIVFVAALAGLDAERGAPDATIITFPDALWWAVTTVSTVGYGDLYPVTTTGRLVAVGLMVGGVALLGLVTATLASWLIDRVSAVEETSQAATRRDLEAVTAELARLREQLAGSGQLVVATPAQKQKPDPQLPL